MKDYEYKLVVGIAFTDELLSIRAETWVKKVIWIVEFKPLCVYVCLCSYALYVSSIICGPHLNID